MSVIETGKKQIDARISVGNPKCEGRWNRSGEYSQQHSYR